MYMAPGRLLSPIAAGAGAPSLDFNFIGYTADTLPSAISFSRAGMAWQYDSSGVLVTVPHNLLTNSQDFDASAWTKSETTVSANVLANPLDGAVNADKILDSTNSAVHQVFQSFTFTTGLAYTFSVYAKSAERTFLSIACPASLGSGISEFDLSAGTATRDGTMVAAGVTVAIAAVGSAGWYRCSLSGTATSTASGAFGMRLRAVSGTSTYAGTGTSGLYLFGAQLGQSSSLRPYLTTSVKNLLGFSEQFDNAAWTKTLATVTANATAGPFDGTGQTTADKLVEDTTVTAQHYARQAVAVVAGATYTQSVYVKAAERSRFRMEMASAQFSANERAIYDVSTGTIVSNTGGSPTITSVGNGYYRLSLTGTCTTSGSPVFVFMLMPNSGTNSTYTGDGTSGLYIFGAQLSSSGSLDAYSPNVAAAPTSAAYYGPAFDYAYNGTAWVAQGLRIEEARTNLLTYSNDFSNAAWTKGCSNGTTVPAITTAYATGPDGLTSAQRVVLTLPGDTEWALVRVPGMTLTAAIYSLSVWVKANGGGQVGKKINLGQYNGTGFTQLAQATLTDSWQRVTAVGVGNMATGATNEIFIGKHRSTNTFSGGGGLTNAEAATDFLVYGAQLELGSFVTSHIPTTSATVTRAVDVATVNPLGSWFNNSAGTVFAEFQRIGFPSGQLPRVWSFSDNSTNNLIELLWSTSSEQFSVVTGGVSQVSIAGVNGGTALNKVAGAWEVNNVMAYINGSALGGLDTVATIPTVTQLLLGNRMDMTAARQFSGYIRKLRVYTRRLPNAILQVLTT